MIYKVVIENFFSIAERQELFFPVPRNAPDSPYFKKSLSDGEIRLPTVIGFFGPNASGKSTILRAVINSVMFSLHSFDWENQINVLFKPYQHKDWWEKPTKITIEFDSQLRDETPAAIFKYELQVAHKPNDSNNKTVLFEALSYAPQGKFRCLFERRAQNFHFGQEFGVSNNDDARKDSIRSNASVISTLRKLNHPLSIYLSKLIATMQTNYMGVTKIQQNLVQWLSIYVKDKKCLSKLNQELRRLDVGLESMSIASGDQGVPFAKFKHVGLDGDIYFSDESSGTQRFVETFPRLHYALETGSVVLLDELDNDFHPLLLPELFRWFGSSERNPYGAQLFFTAHNPTLLDNLEKEQVFFTEKLSGQSTHVYGARDIKGLRREPSLMKKYLSGELGAVPRIG